MPNVSVLISLKSFIRVDWLLSTNPFVSSDVDDEIRRRFLCCLYQLSRNRNDVHENGMVPSDIYNLLELSPEGEEPVNRKVQWVVDRSRENGYIEPGDNGRIKITNDGNKHCESIDEYGRSYCSGLPSYSEKAKAVILTPFTTTGQSVAAQLSDKQLAEDVLLPTYIETDIWTTKDKLNYEIYAIALANCLTKPETKPPLSVSIQAPWGGGKSSIMRMVQGMYRVNRWWTRCRGRRLTIVFAVAKIVRSFVLSHHNINIVKSDNHMISILILRRRTL